MIGRREFITLVGGAAAWPLMARAQQPTMPVVGFLSSVSAPHTAKRIASFAQGLSETSYAVGRDVTIEQRLAEGQYERLPALAADLVSRRVNLIAALTPQAAFAAKAATTTIPIVFVAALDPVKAGLVASLNRPGGNVTGVTFIGSSLGVKRLELARELVPNVEVIALLTHPHSPDALEELRDLQIAAKTIGQQLVAVTATSDRDFEAAFASVVRHRAGGAPYWVGPVPLSKHRTTRRTGGPISYPGNLSIQREHHSGRLDELRCQHPGRVAVGWHLCWKNSQRGETGGIADRAAD